MSADSEDIVDGRIGNVSIGLLLPELADTAAEISQRMGRWVHELMWVGPRQGEGKAPAALRRVECASYPLARLVAALLASEAPRVLLLTEDVGAECVLGLTAWPEADIVLPAAPGAALETSCVLYRRESVLPAALELESAGGREVSPLFESLEVSRLRR